jgi:NADH-quinone oxidoreductase subunit L
MPQTAFVFVIGTLSLAGIPLFAGFVSKEEILGAVWAHALPGPFFILMLVAFLTAFYMFRVVFRAFFGGSRLTRENHGAHEHDPPASMLLPLWILTLLCMAIGVYFAVVPVEAEFESPNWLTPAAVSVALAGSILAWLTYQRKAIDASTLATLFGPIRRAALAKFWIDAFFEHVLAAATLAFSRLVGWIDRYLVDGVLNVVSAWTVTTGDEMRSIQTGRAQDYVYGLAVGLLLLLAWVRWSLP